MTPEETKAFMRRYLDAVCTAPGKPAEVVDQFVASDSLKQHIAYFESAFPGYVVHPDDMVVEGDKVAVQATVTGVHKGEFLGIPPTGKELSSPAIYIYRIANGKIVAFTGILDMITAFQQLGLKVT